MKVIVHIMPKENLLDPEGAAIQYAMHRLGYDKTNNVRVGKTVQFTISGIEDRKLLTEQVDKLCQQLLSNTNIEDYRYEINPADKTDK